MSYLTAAPEIFTEPKKIESLLPVEGAVLFVIEDTKPEELHAVMILE